MGSHFVAFIPNIPSSLGAISEFDKAITELLRHGAGELSSRIQLLIEDMVTRWLALDERTAAFDAEFASLAIGISTCVDVAETFSSDREEEILGVPRVDTRRYLGSYLVRASHAAVVSQMPSARNARPNRRPRGRTLQIAALLRCNLCLRGSSPT